MNAVSSVATVSSGGWSHAAAPLPTVATASVTASAQPAKSPQNSTDQARPSLNALTQIAPVKIAPVVTAQNQQVPLGILQTVGEPSSANGQATLDYHNMRLALQTGNLALAQQAYVRLQGDLDLASMAASLAANSHLNLSA